MERNEKKGEGFTDSVESSEQIRASLIRSEAEQARPNQKESFRDDFYRSAPSASPVRPRITQRQSDGGP